MKLSIFFAQVKVAPVYPASSLTATANSPKTTAKPASRPQPPQKEAEIIRGQSAAEAPEFLVHSAKYELMNQEIENEFDMVSFFFICVAKLLFD